MLLRDVAPVATTVGPAVEETPRKTTKAKSVRKVAAANVEKEDHAVGVDSEVVAVVLPHVTIVGVEAHVAVNALTLKVKGTGTKRRTTTTHQQNPKAKTPPAKVEVVAVAVAAAVASLEDSIVAQEPVAAVDQHQTAAANKSRLPVNAKCMFKSKPKKM